MTFEPPTQPPKTGDLSSEEFEFVARCFNTALISTRAETQGASPLISEALSGLIQSPAYRQILAAVQRHAAQQGLPETQAAREVIETFRQLDSAWQRYVFSEGLARLKESGLK